MTPSVFSELPAKISPPTVAHQCATMLFLRNLISEKDKQQVADVISQLGAEPEAATNELSRRGFISKQNEAVAAQFIKRAVRRSVLKVRRGLPAPPARTYASAPWFHGREISPEKL